MLNNLKILQNRYGYLSGLKAYIQIKLNKKGNLKLPKLQFPFYYRPNTIDEYTIIEIFGEDCYNIDLPFEPKFIIDAGANIGLSTVYFANRYPNAAIVAIEPEGNNYQLLKRNAGHYPGIETIHSAIWKNNANLEIRDKGYGLRGFVVEEVKEASDNSFVAMSINEIVGERDWVDVFKMDIEGSEKYLFQENYEAWLPKVKCLIIELHDDMVEDSSATVFKVMETYNFTYFKKEENWIFMNSNNK